MRRRLVLRMKGTQNRAAQRPREKGPLARGRECANPSQSRRSLLPVSGPPSPSLGGLCCYLFHSSIHPPPTLVSHPYLSSSARPLSHSFRRSVSCCSPHRPVQGSHPHQRGSECQLCVFNTEVTAFPRAASPPFPYGQPIWLEISFAILEWMSSGDVALFSPMILACRGQGHPRQYILAVWIPFTRPQALLPPRRGPWV